jgi:glyoxylase-like metal-dependent hydrolase (beta-lactamase superfamily II)
VGNRVEAGHTVQPVKPDCLIEETVDLNPLGFDANIIHTPGHSPGSCSVIIENHIAVVGDAMFGLIPGSIFPPFALNVPRLIQSWKTLLDTGCSVYLPAHGTENNRDRVQKQYKKCAARINK